MNALFMLGSVLLLVIAAAAWALAGPQKSPKSV